MENGLFITLADEPSLALYLREGVFSQHQQEEPDDDIDYRRTHYAVMADYACAREGTHVFFFREREIFYGGRVISAADDSNIGAFYLNGETSPMGRRADADLGWDESERYGGVAGVWEQKTRSGTKEIAQPFLLRFDTDVEHAGKYIRSDDLYFELGDYPYPLKSNTIRNTGFCPMGPGETRELLDQIEKTDETYSPSEDVDVPDIVLDESKIEPFRPKYGIDKVSRESLTNEDHLEASIIADPSVLPDELAPDDHQSIVRQAPISPLKPMNIDQIDVVFYDPDFEGGMYPTKVLELKYSEATVNNRRDDAEQILRYRRATDKMAEYHLSADPDEIDVGMYAPYYNEDHFSSAIPESEIERINFRQFDETPDIPQFASRLNSC